MALSNEEREEFIRLCQAAKAATQQQQNKAACNYFRQAIQIHPFSSRVWFELAKVVERDDDRRVALENVLALDPSHHEARQMLKEMN